MPDTHRKQAEYELGVIIQMGFPGYFLVVGDLCRHAREAGIRVGPGRGSAAGSLVAYALGITELDPVEHRLLFERFLNPERVSMPDIDLDFDERRRGDMIRYATEKYGEDRVSQIITYGTIKAKQAVKDSSRVLGYPFSTGDRITKVMPPPVMGKDIPLAGIFDPEHARYKEATEFRALYESDAEVKRVVDTARGLEGLKRQWGVHAAGVILSREPLLDVIPIQRREQDGAIITQFDMGACESLGLLKMDFLGLRNLTVLDDCLANIRGQPRRGRRPGGPATRRPVGVRAAGPRRHARACSSSTAARCGRCCARCGRPRSRTSPRCSRSTGPGRWAPTPTTNTRTARTGASRSCRSTRSWPSRWPRSSDETYGLIVYQEQVMAIAQKVAGYSLGKADLLRRAMGKKKKEILDKEYVPFSEGMKENGYSDGAIKTLWDILVPFSDYAFNRAHTAGYGLVSYWTAYLKANYPAEYMAALLTSVKDDKDKSAVYLNECRRMGIKVLPPDVNSSDADFTTVGTDIRFGLTAVRNVGRQRGRLDRRHPQGQGRVRRLLRLPQEGRPGRLQQEGRRVADQGRRVRLARAHPARAHGGLRPGRRQLPGREEGRGDRAVRPVRRSRPAADDVLDPVFAVTVPDGEWDKMGKLAFEREMLGLYVSDHPLLGVEHVLAAHAEITVGALHTDQVGDGQQIVLAGILSSVLRRVNKAGAPWASAVLEDLEGSVEVLFFPQTYAQVAVNVAEDAIVVVKGRVDRREDVAKLIASDLSVPDLSEGPRGPVVVSLQAARCTPPVVERLQGGARHPPGHHRGAAAAGQRRSADRAAGGGRLPGGRDTGADGRSEGAAGAHLPGRVMAAGQTGE